jgi:hypothetical protein
MSIKKTTLFIFLISFIFSNISAQVSVKDSSITTPLVGISYGFQLSGGDLVKRFGNSSSLGGSLELKLKSKWTIGINGSYFFGKTVKENLFDSIDTSVGAIINRSGEYADVRTFERGFTISGTVGRLFTLKNKKPNPNSGVLFDIGVGFIQHKIRIETIGNNVPQLSTEYKKGYDRLSNGFLLSENLCYLYVSSNRFVNVYFGFEFMQGFTQSRRSWDYDLMRRDTQKRVDLLSGVKIAWILPLYKKAPEEFYTY